MKPSKISTRQMLDRFYDEPAIISNYNPMYDKVRSCSVKKGIPSLKEAQIAANQENARVRCDELRKLIRARGDCDHRTLNEHEEDRDNGYGRWWKVKIETCVYCGARRSDGRYWQSYEDWLRG